MTDTIAAVSTPFGRGGIAVIRISGGDAVRVADAMFTPASGEPLRCRRASSVTYGDIICRGERIDDGCATVFLAPHSFTGEDTVEISCHGGIIVTSRVYEAALVCGARAAGPGEFTKRAFLNGRISLTQAEAVGDLIEAQSDEAARLAASGTAGLLSREISDLRGRITELVSAAYVQADFPDEDLSGLDTPAAVKALREILGDTDALLGTYRAGKAVSCGINTVICGRPNTGKSSLLNLLLGRERAIVTDKPGTTRDTIEERCVLGRVTLALCDTAGIREGADEIESMGIARAEDALAACELAVAVFDISEPLNGDDLRLLTKLDADKTIIVLNKTDLAPVLSEGDFPGFGRVVRLCCADGAGRNELARTAENMFIAGEIDYSHAIVTNARQYAALLRARDYTLSALASLEAGATADVAGLDLELALGALAECDGAAVAQEIVDGIFARFCVGK